MFSFARARLFCLWWSLSLLLQNSQLMCACLCLYAHGKWRVYFTRGRAGSPARRTTGCSDSLPCPFQCPSVTGLRSEGEPESPARERVARGGWGKGRVCLEEEGPSAVCAHSRTPPLFMVCPRTLSLCPAPPALLVPALSLVLYSSDGETCCVQMNAFGKVGL